MATDSNVLNRYYDILENALKENSIFNNPLCIFNCEETGMPLNPKLGKIVCQRGLC